MANLVLDTTRRSRHQLPRLLMQDQRSRVHVKKLANASQQLEEQVIDVKSCERAVSQRLGVRQTLRDSTVTSMFDNSPDGTRSECPTSSALAK
jgi:hypothetical protein